MKKEQFELTDVKILTAKTTINYKLTRTIGSEASVDEFKHSSKTPVAESFKKAIIAFNGFLAKAFLVPDKQKQHVATNGIAITYDDESNRVCIKGMIQTKSGALRAINTEAIPYDGEAYGFEGELEGMVDAVIDEAFLYVTGKKIGTAKDLFNEESKQD